LLLNSALSTDKSYRLDALTPQKYRQCPEGTVVFSSDKAYILYKGPSYEAIFIRPQACGGMEDVTALHPSILETLGFNAPYTLLGQLAPRETVEDFCSHLDRLLILPGRTGSVVVTLQGKDENKREKLFLDTQPISLFAASYAVGLLVPKEVRCSLHANPHNFHELTLFTLVETNRYG
jgi:hypothetical protein